VLKTPFFTIAALFLCAFCIRQYIQTQINFAFSLVERVPLCYIDL
jgi:hypothetical protein